jgi:putative ABC transport system permease protein
MITILLKSTIRNLLKHKSGGIINILGLSIGMAAAVLIFMWVQNEMNFDNYHPAKNNIYHLAVKKESSNDKFAGTPLVLADEIKKQVPDIDKACRLIVEYDAYAPKLGINNNFFKEKNVAYIDKEWFDVFHYDFVAGNNYGFGNNRNSIILTESVAKKYYGNSNPVGQVIHIDSTGFQVTAVIKDNPPNSSFQFNVLLPIESYFKNNPGEQTAWLRFRDQTFVKLRNGMTAKTAGQKINSIFLKEEQLKMILEQGDKKDTLVSVFTPIRDFHFMDNASFSKFSQNDKKTVYIFSILGFLLLTIACINYVNLTTARASKRSKEVSIKKIIGADRKSLFTQFLFESIFTGIIALLITLLLVKLSLPAFNRFTEKNFSFSLFSGELWKVAGSTLLVAILLTGIYPAILLSSFKPLNMLRGLNILTVKNTSLRKILVTSQFTIAIVLMICTVVILKQLNYMHNNNEGYNRSQIFSFSIPSSWYKSHPDADKNSFKNTLKNELKSYASIKNITAANDAIQNLQMGLGGSINWVGKQKDNDPVAYPLSVDPDFNKIFNLELKEGRWFREDEATGKKSYILNETTVNELGLQKPYIGQFFSFSGDTGQIIGIVKDFHFHDYRQKIGITVLYSDPDFKGTLFIQANTSNIKQAIASAESTWKKFFPQELFEYTFMDEGFAQMYKADIKTSRLVGTFSGIAIFLCCLGLLGLVSFIAEQKTKEIGIRKILGASVANITTLLSKDFIIMVLIAVAIASPIAWWAMNKWLEEFVYRIHIAWWMFAGAGLLALLIAVSTISFQAIKAAIANPAKALRTE